MAFSCLLQRSITELRKITNQKSHKIQPQKSSQKARQKPCHPSKALATRQEDFPGRRAF